MVRYERRRICRGPFEGRSNTSQYLRNIYRIFSDVDEAISNHIAKEGHWRPSWQDMLSSPSAIAGPSSASPAVDSYEARLHTAWSTGALTKEEYETKIKEHRQPNAPTAVATRVKGDTIVAKYDWLPAAGPFGTKKLAIEGVRTIQHGRWKYDRKGDKKLLVCNAHVDCQVKLRFKQSSVDGSFSVLVSNLAHSLEPQSKPRRNSVFTYEQQEEIMKGTDSGKRPREMLLDATEVLLKTHPGAEKRPEGGLEGVWLRPTLPHKPTLPPPCLIGMNTSRIVSRSYRLILDDIRRYLGVRWRTHIERYCAENAPY